MKIPNKAKTHMDDPRPSLESASWWFDRASWALIASLILGALSTFLIVWMGTVKEEHWDLLREKSNLRVAELFRETIKFSADLEASKAQIADANARASEAKLETERLKLPRTLTPERREYVSSAIKQFQGQRYRAAISQGADDGLALWESIYAALTNAGWVYVPSGSPGVGSPPAGIPIAAIPGIEIRLDASRENELAPAALSLGNALHDDGMVVAINKQSPEANSDEYRDTLFLVIGARLPSQKLK